MQEGIEASLRTVLDRMKARQDTEEGAGAFDHSVKKGLLILSKRKEDMSPDDLALQQSPPPARRQ
ncbi:hypothetical protein [Tropicimonas aquimaris]|uniref:Uncharacterized protein n=1 Tax=Tropicimonas aquimaris TaxID=914152 RepID=A0ABW3IPJ1_9RHOB